MARRLLGKGETVVLTVMFRDVDAAVATHAIASKMLFDAATEIGDLGVVAGDPSSSAKRRSMSLTLRPREAGGSAGDANQPPDRPSDPPGGVREPRKPTPGEGNVSAEAAI
jgi:hypothetical protein